MEKALITLREGKNIARDFEFNKTKEKLKYFAFYGARLEPQHIFIYMHNIQRDMDEIKSDKALTKLKTKWPT